MMGVSTKLLPPGLPVTLGDGTELQLYGTGSGKPPGVSGPATVGDCIWVRHRDQWWATGERSLSRVRRRIGWCRTWASVLGRGLVHPFPWGYEVSNHAYHALTLTNGTFIAVYQSGNDAPPGARGQHCNIPSVWVRYAGAWYRSVERTAPKLLHQLKQCDYWSEVVEYKVVHPEPVADGPLRRSKRAPRL